MNHKTMNGASAAAPSLHVGRRCGRCVFEHGILFHELYVAGLLYLFDFGSCDGYDVHAIAVLNGFVVFVDGLDDAEVLCLGARHDRTSLEACFSFRLEQGLLGFWPIEKVEERYTAQGDKERQKSSRDGIHGDVFAAA